GAGGRLQRLSGPLAVAAFAFVAWMAAATFASDNPLTARPSMRWIATAAVTGLAVAARSRDAAGWTRVLVVPVAAATAVALCDVALTVRIAAWFGTSNALATRLELFRQHPNFLASLYGFHAVLALALVGVRPPTRWFGLFAVAALGFATWHTDSNAGRAALLLGAAAIPAVWLLARVARRVGDRVVVGGVVAAVALGAAGLVAAAGGSLGVGALEGKVDRFRKSFEFRIAAWDNAVDVVRDHPVVGVGPHVFVAAEPFAHGSRFATEPAPPHPHDVPLYVAQSGGLPALAAFLAWMVLLFARLLRAVRERGGGAIPAALVVGPLAAGAGLSAANVLDLGLALDTVVPWPLWWITGLALSLDPPRREAPLPGVSLLVATGLLLAAATLAWTPLSARVELSRARVLAAEGPRNPRLPDPRGRLVAALQRAIRRDPSLEPAYVMLESAVAADVEERRSVLLRYLDQGPDYGHVRSRVGQFEFESGAYEDAVETLSYAFEDRFWCDSILQDRARYVRALGHLARVDEAETALRATLLSNHELVRDFPVDESGRRVVEIHDALGDAVATIDLGEQLDVLRGELSERRERGEEVSRRDWMQIFFAYRAAGLDDDAEAYLDFLAGRIAEIEPESILRERARLALDRGDRQTAVKLYEEAYRLTGTETFRDFARQAAGRERAAEVRPLAHIGDLMAWRPAYELALDTRIEAAIRSGAYADAAGDMRRRLFFASDPGDRARRLVKLAEALEASNAPQREIEATYRSAMEHLLAKPYTTEHLSVRFDESLPGRIAESVHELWREAGRTPEEIEGLALAWPGIRSVHSAALLFQLGLYRALGDPDALLRTAKLLALVEPGCDIAFLAELTALEATAPPRVIRDTARDHLLLRILHPVHEEPQSPFGRAVAMMLNGAYNDAAAKFKEIFQQAQPGRDMA
ncbi:MAG: O-antigen ligase family protein, partial [Planctomycetota bacterium JB042]